MDPKTFEDAVASATRLETLDKTRSSGKIMGAAAEIKKEIKENDPVNELVARFGVVLARLENMPQQNKNPGVPGVRYNQWGHGKPMQPYQNKNFQNVPDNSVQTATAGSEEKGQELEPKEMSEAQKKKEGYFRGDNYRRWDYDRRKYCMAHQKVGHSTDSCAWLKDRLQEIPPPEKTPKRVYKTCYGRKDQGN